MTRKVGFARAAWGGVVPWLALLVVLPAPRVAAAGGPPDAPGIYVIQPGDELEIRFFDTPELDAEVRVRPDGRIALPLAGGVVAAGRTPEELAAELQRLHARELRDPRIAVLVKTFSAHVVHVGGEVHRPGVFDLADRMTVLDAILRAGGALDTARLKQVLVIRRGSGTEPVVIPVDLRRVLDAESPQAAPLLEPYDAVFVPKSRIARVNTWAQQYVWNNLPVVFRVVR